MFSRFFRVKKHLFVAGMPKSGTTFLIRAMISAAVYETEFPSGKAPKVIPIDFFNSTKHFSEEEFSLVKNKTTLGKMHLVGEQSDLDFLSRNKFFTVFIYRNLFDVIASMKRHFDESEKECIIPDYHQLSDNEKYDGVIEYFVPNLLRMYYNFTRGALGQCLILNYSQLIAAPYEQMSDVLKQAKIGYDDTILRDAGEQKYGTFRGGTPGQGKQKLNKQHINAVYEKISLHECSYDFEPFLDEGT